MTVIDGGKGTGQAPPGGGQGASDWRTDLTYTKDGAVQSTTHNLLTIIENDAALAGLFRLDEFANRVALSRDPPWQGSSFGEFVEADSLELAGWLGHPERYRMAVSDELVSKCVEAVARRYKFHPVREFLDGLKWDGKPRVERMLIDLYAATDRLYNRQASLCFMVSAVARILWVNPIVPRSGAKVDFMLVLEGKQGVRKTSSLMALFGDNWYVETHDSPAGKDFYQSLLGRWAVEIAEMDSFGKADIANVKGAITRRFDVYRPPYGRVPRTFRRECVFVGTTNEAEYLRDHTGGRRFLPVISEGETSLDQIEAQREQLWAEAVQLFRDGFEWFKLPDEAEEEQEARFFEDSWESRVARWLRGQAVGERAYPARMVPGMPVEWATTDELLMFAIGVEVAKHGRPEQMRVANIMKRLGYYHARPWITKTERERRWYPVGVDPKVSLAPAGARCPVEEFDEAP